jgi:hypothetical protein
MADRQAYARLVPYVQRLNEAQRREILSRLGIVD